jgi:hypothetical protein
MNYEYKWQGIMDGRDAVLVKRVVKSSKINKSKRNLRRELFLLNMK